MNTNIVSPRNVLQSVPLAFLLFVLGCSGQPTALVGGTSGSLTSDGQAVSQMQVNVFDKQGSTTPIGRGFVADDGSFELVTDDGLQPLVLDDGKYYFTVESIGAEVEIPKDYTSSRTTPLVAVISGDSTIMLDVPGLSQGM
jgi:hypothetical protein